jgi:hypothetical protein
MEGVRKVKQKIENVGVFVGSDIQSAAVLNNPRQYANAVPIMLLPPGDLPTILYPYTGPKSDAESGVYFAQDGKSAQADIFRRIIERCINRIIL